MIVKRFTKSRLVKAVFGCLFGIIGIFGGMMAPVEPVYAVPAEEVVDENVTETNDGSAESPKKVAESVSCDDTLGSLAWLACPGTGAISKATDFLYEKIESILVINPVEMKDGEPVYEIWKYAKGVANIIFIGFLLVVVYSQITGMGINNYGIKKILPKLIVAAVLVNLSFIICSLAVDVSNIIGGGVRGLFTSIGEATVGTSGVSESVRLSEIYASIGGGTLLTVGVAAIVWGPGAIWMLMATVLGAIVAVVIGLVTIAMRQAVVMLLIMISPLAVVAYMLPNTEKWFKMWKELLMRMLVFYPLFSLLFGASALAGWAIIASAKEDGFMVILGVAVQTFPLFFSWSLMKMSGTVLGTINSKLTALASKPLAQNRAWAESRRDAARAKALASGRVYTPSLALRQYMSERKIARDEETNEHNNTIKNRGLAYAAKKNYKKDGTPSREGLRAYEEQARNMRYTAAVDRHKTNMNSGYGELDAVKQIAAKENPTVKEKALLSKLKALDLQNMNAADDLKSEVERGAEVEYRNNVGYFERVLDAKLAKDDHEALVTGNEKHQMHPGVLDDPENLARYERLKKIMDGRDDGVQTVLSGAASSARAQAQIRRNKFEAAADLTPATQNVADHIRDLVESSDVAKNIDAIIGGLRVLNMRGDTDMVGKEMVYDLVGVLHNRGNIKLGTYASQAIANYAMFDVKGNDPVIRRFGKYINMQTAALYNDNAPEKRRKRKDVSWWEYVNSQYVEHDENGNVAYDDDGNVVIRKTRGLVELMRGTPWSDIERTAYKWQREGIRIASYDIDSDGNLSTEFNLDKYLDKMDEVYISDLPNIVGDHLGYRSGSEQVKSFAKDITGIGEDGKWDWKYMCGDELPNPTLEQKAKLIMRSRDMVKNFLKGFVPSQIARSKSDVLAAIESQYALLDEVMREDDNGEEVVDLERLRAIDERVFNDGGEDTPGSYANFLREKQDAIRKRFQGSFKEEALKGYAKQYEKGYQGESKDKLIKMLDPEALYARYFGSRNNQQRRTQNNNEDNDEGMPVGNDLDDLASGGGVYNDAREMIREVFERYRGSDGLNVEGCWSEVSDALRSSAEMGDLSISLAEFEEGLSQYTSVSQLRHDVMRLFFGDR